ncbi:MAG: hypothetical protein H6867_07535 [Rhodospirillales bacterium]|nr:hypothetical protein [Rhodospirillales bacterium]MCB9995403.1 hypothetical protein [Rhodospirillales bacterium]
MMKKHALSSFLAVSLAAVFNSSVVADDGPLLGNYGLVPMPHCVDGHGRTVKYYGVSTQTLRQAKAGLARAFFDGGQPVVEYDKERLPRANPEFQKHVLWHECVHHQRDHFRPHISDEFAEREADCGALKINGYDLKTAMRIADTMDALYPYDPNAMIQAVATDMHPVLKRCFE